MSQHTMHPHSPGSATVGLHGMLLVGEDPMFALHLPMFMAPHNYQVVLEVTLPDDVRDRLRAVRAEAGPDALVTLKPEPFPIVDLAEPGEGRQPLTGFHADVVDGHFEHGGHLLAEAATVMVDDVFYFRELDVAAPGAVDAEDGELPYLLFGDADRDLFLAHRIGSRPSFDQTLRVTVEGDHFTQAELDRQGRPTVSVSGRRDTHSDRLRQGEVVAAHSSAGLHFQRALQVSVVSEVYVNSDELQ